MSEQLPEPREALGSYLDALLTEAVPIPPVETTVGAAPSPRIRNGTEPVRGEGAAPRGERRSPDEPPSGKEAGTPPAWAQPDFQALLFQVGRLKLAVPLLKLHSVVPWTEHISAMPNQPRWCHGLFRYRERNVVVIDTKRLVLPDDRLRTDDAKAGAEHILIVGDGRWGLACRTVGEVVRLTPAEVKWRSGRSRRPWLAGTVLGQLCALMDTEAFSAMLSEARGAS